MNLASKHPCHAVNIKTINASVLVMTDEMDNSSTNNFTTAKNYENFITTLARVPVQKSGDSARILVKRKKEEET